MMFDKVTRTIIRQATPLKGLDLNRLPQELTAAYAKIVSLRVAGQEVDGFKDEIEKIERIGKTYLALLLSCRDEHYQAVAFVAASAYSIVASYRNEIRTDIFSRNSVCPLCSSVLLFIIADAVSSASEVAGRYFHSEGGNSIYGKISQSICDLSLGNLNKIDRTDAPVSMSQDLESFAVALLYEKCLHGIFNLCSLLLGEGRGTFDDVLNEFLEVKALSVEDISQDFGEGQLGDGIYSAFSGPFILSSLLYLAVNLPFLVPVES